MIWTSTRNKFRGILSRNALLFPAITSVAGKRTTRRSTTTLATILFIGTTTIGGSSFYFSSVSNNNRSGNGDNSRSQGGNNLILATSSSSNVPTESRRTHTTADKYFQKWKKIPLSSVMHDNLERMILTGEKQSRVNNVTTSSENSSKLPRNNRILVIGDVHGCLEELRNLVQKATREHNHGKQFAAIVLVGDLCNKGPSSAEVIHYVRNQPRWFSVRGNHEDRALAAALGDEECCSKPKYQWVNALSDDDVTWMSNLPYTITIPKKMLNFNYSRSSSAKKQQDVIIVHAGLDPTIALENQETKTMITIRNLIVNNDGTTPSKVAWAKMWQGTELIIFGHDAKRGLQQEENAIGLDSGCVYGKKLTGVILPEREFVYVDAVSEHCLIKKKKVI